MNFMRIFLCIVTFYFFSPDELSAKIRIFTFHYNSPEFLEFQYKTFKKFILDDYEIFVVNDAPDSTKEKSIRDVCEKYDLMCVRYEQEWHRTDPINEKIRMMDDTPQKNSYFLFPFEEGSLDLRAVSEQPSVRHCHVIQYALDHFGYDHDDIVVIMDADVFPVKPIRIRDLLKDVPLMGVDSEFRDKHYLWVPFIAFDPKRLPEVKDLKFHLGVIDEMLCDTGSYSAVYLKEHPEVPFRLYPRCPDYDFYPWDATTFLAFGFNNPYDIAKISWPITLEFYIDYHFIHYIGGAAHVKSAKKLQATYDFLNCLLKE